MQKTYQGSLKQASKPTSEINSQESLSIKQAAEQASLGITAIYSALKLGRLKGRKRLIKRQLIWSIKRSDLENYLKSRHDRHQSTFKGRPLYDKNYGECSINEAAKILGVRPCTIYRMIDSRKIKAKKKGMHWVLNVLDLQRILAIKLKKIEELS